MQPYKYHSNIPGGSDRNIKKQYIYVYSFALNPEEYQPSGAYNFSKDNDTANFNFTFHTDIGNSKAVPAISASANALGSGARDYQITLFTWAYKYLTISAGSVDKKQVPVLSSGSQAMSVSNPDVPEHTHEQTSVHTHDKLHSHDDEEKSKESGKSGVIEIKDSRGKRGEKKKYARGPLFDKIFEK